MKCPHCDGTGNIEITAIDTGTLILAHRKTSGLTQEQLAAEVGYSRSQIANIEIGRSDMPLKTLARFAKALNVSMKDLVP